MLALQQFRPPRSTNRLASTKRASTRTRAARVALEMMSFRFLSKLLIVVALGTPATAQPRPAKNAPATQVAKETAHEAAVVAKQAKSYYGQKQYALAAELYRRAIIDQAGGEAIRGRVVLDLANAAHDVGIGLDSEAGRALRTNVKDSGL